MQRRRRSSRKFGPASFPPRLVRHACTAQCAQTLLHRAIPPSDQSLLFGPHCVQGEARHRLSAAEAAGDSTSVSRHASVYPRSPIPAPGAYLVASSHPSLPPPPSQTLIVLRRGTFSVVDRRHGRISRSPTICGTQVSSGNHLASNPPAFKKSKNLELTHPYYPPLPWPRRRPHRRQQPKRSGSSALLPLAGRRRERRDRQKARGAWDGAQGACHGRRQPLGPPSGGPPKPPWVRKCVFTTCTVRESVYHVHTCIIRPCNTR